MLLCIRAALGGVALLAFAGAGTAPARVAADAPPASFKLERLGSLPASVEAGKRVRVRGSVANAKGRRAQRARLTFSLRTARSAPARGAVRLRGVNIKRTRGGRSRSFSVRVRVRRGVAARRYVLFACVRRGSGSGMASCKGRAIRVTAPPGTPVPAPPGTIEPPPASPSPPSGLAQQSLRAPLIGENYYFVMADRFENADTANDHGGLPEDKNVSGFDPTGRGWYHGGDLEGLLSRIDYIKDLGTTAIWLTPSFKNKPVQGLGTPNVSAGYHGYWITDFTQIDPHLGTNQDLADLVDAAHARGMKVFFDIITNHTAEVIQYERKPGGPAPYLYTPKDETPYRTAAGDVFDDRDFAGTGAFPALDPATSFPFVPKNPAGAEDPDDVNHKVPEWLNDLTVYHNRGDTTFVGENSQYGDFFGLDDLFTEQPRVVDGMADIYEKWIRDYGIDGFRIDTMKHVNDEFWRQFAPRVLDYARRHGKSEFLMFGEVFDTTKTYTSHFTTRDEVQAVLDFPFQAAAQGFAAASAPTNALRDFFVGDDWYTDADSNAYQLPTFLGNHDMGRIGMFLRNGNAGAPDSEILDRDRLAHELMYFSRGNPVIYYGDEQGFVGDGGDQLARQDMFPSQVPEYNDDDLIGTDATTAESNFDESHPLYEAIARLAQVTREHPALRDGAQQHRYSSDAAGIYAFSRLDRASQHEYVVALNNSEQPRSAPIQTSAGREAAFERVYGDGGAGGVTDSRQRLSVTVPPLSAVVYRSAGAIPRSAAAPPVSLVALPEGGEARDRAEVRAFVHGGSFYDVTFEAKTGDGAWTPIGTDDNAPYRVLHDVGDLAPGTPVRYRATVLDNAGQARTSPEADALIGEPAISMTGPPDGGRVRDRVTLGAEASPDHNDYLVTFFRKAAGGEWQAVGTDASQPAYSVQDDVSGLGLAEGTQISYRAQLTYAPGRTVTSETRTVAIAPPPLDTAIVHYNRPGGDYDDWGLHLWGDAIADGVATTWDAPRQRDEVDDYGAVFAIPLKDDTQAVNFILHRPSGDMVPTTREPGGDRSFRPIDHPEIWLRQGDPAIYFSDPG